MRVLSIQPTSMVHSVVWYSCSFEEILVGARRLVEYAPLDMSGRMGIYQQYRSHPIGRRRLADDE